MEFDEYEYLEKTVEEQKPNHETKSRSDDAANGHKRDERDRSERSRDRDRERERSRDRNREREKSRDRDLEREKSRDRDRDREREKSRDRHRDREREKSREHDRDKEREKSRDRDRDRDRERRSRDRDMDYRESSRSRRDRDERERSRRSRSRSMHEREREMSRERERERRERELEREIREKERESSRRYKDKKEPLEPEADPERDQRTVFAYQMPLKATERDVYEFFSKAGKVRDVRLIMDRNSRRSKGVGYIEFYDVMSVPMAIALSGEELLGQPVKVKPSEAEKNLVQSTTGASGVTGAAAARKIYVGNLHFNINEDQLRQLFEPFGPVELVQLPLDLETGQCKGYGFVQFAQVEHARAAQSLNGKLEIAGRAIKVSAVTDHVTVPEPGANAADLDDDEGGLSLNAQSRALLMQKLDRTGTASNVAESLGVPVVNGVTQPIQQSLPLPINGQPMMLSAAPTLLNPTLATMPAAAVTIGEPSECLLLKNMFDPKTETDPEFDLEIRDDVQEECSKFGPVKHIFVDKDSNGNVYLRFDNVIAASSCQRAMHLRWFAGRAISATFMKPSEYEAKFGTGA